MLPLIVPLVLVAAGAAGASPKVRVVSGIEVTPLLGADRFPKGVIAASDVTPSRILIASGTAITDSTGVAVLKAAATVSDVATVGAEIVVVAGKELLFANDAGTRTGVVKLPAAGMRLATAAGDRTLYLYGGAAGSVYRLGAGGAYVDLFRVDEPITALAVAGDRIVFAVGGDLFTWKSGEDAVLIARLPDGIVTSLAIDGRAGIVYGSTADTVFAVADGSILALIEGVGGDLTVIEGKLTVLQGTRRALLGISGMEKLLGTNARP